MAEERIQCSVLTINLIKGSFNNRIFDSKKSSCVSGQENGNLFTVAHKLQ